MEQKIQEIIELTGHTTEDVESTQKDKESTKITFKDGSYLLVGQDGDQYVPVGGEK